MYFARELAEKCQNMQLSVSLVLHFCQHSLYIGNNYLWKVRAAKIVFNFSDDNSRGKILVRLQCTTARQMARCKTRFYLNDIHSSQIFENIFPANEVSEELVRKLTVLYS